jgi:predicted ATP-dependent serine protease
MLGEDNNKYNKVKELTPKSHLLELVDVNWLEFGELLGTKEKKGDKPSMVTVMSANGGFGKTTFALTACAYFCDVKKHNYCIFNSLEEEEFQLLSEIKEKKIENLEEMFVISEPDIVKFLNILKDILKTLPKDASVFIVCDSLQMLFFNEKNDFSTALQIFYRWIKDQSEMFDQTIRALFTSQVTKANKIKGPNKILHCIDRHINLYSDPKTKKRYAKCVEKNRGGAVDIPQEYEIQVGGIFLKLNGE